MYDCILIGAGPSNISCANYLYYQGYKNFLIIDSGKDINQRDHNSSIDCVHGLGGAGLFSDGKFSFYPAGTYIWNNLDKFDLDISYNYLTNVFKDYIDIPDLTKLKNQNNNLDNKDNNLNNNLNWNLKDYLSIYLNLSQRKKLIDDIVNDFKEKILYQTNVVEINKILSHYKVICLNLLTNTQFDFETKNIILGGGRFMPIFIHKYIKWIPLEFKRIELGVRVEGPSSHPLYSISPNTDPKFVKTINSNIEFKTFCWCRNGETVLTQYNLDSDIQIKTWSGRSDINKTSRSNFGFNLVIKDSNQYELVNKIFRLNDFTIPINDILSDNQNLSNNQIPLDYQPIMNILFPEIINYLETFQIDKSNLNLIGPTIEGVGYYPITKNNLQIPNELVWVGGDCGGKFRGIIPSMLSGIYIGLQVCKQLLKSKTKPLVIFIGGKRYVGKGETAILLKKYYESKGKKVFIGSFSYILKINFSREFGLDLDRFLSDHSYKDIYRDELTEYFSKTNSMEYAYYLESIIDKNEYQIYIIDDLRLLEHVEYINTVLKSKYQTYMIKICSNNLERKKRGWVETNYDSTRYETELDDYKGFDKIINNNTSLDDLETFLTN